MSSVCLADVQEFWILCWSFAIMITACLELLSQTEINWVTKWKHTWFTATLSFVLTHSSGNLPDEFVSTKLRVAVNHVCFHLVTHANSKLESINNRCVLSGQTSVAMLWVCSNTTVCWRCGYLWHENNCCIFERLFKKSETGIFLFGISFFVLELLKECLIRHSRLPG